MRKQILVIGSSSNVAQDISECLTNNEYELTGTYNKTNPKNPECYKTLIKINFSNKTEIKKLKTLSNVSDVIFTIGKAEFLDEKVSNINYKTLLNLINYLNSIKNKVRIVFCSSSAVYGNNTSKIIDEKSKKIP